MSNNVDQKKSIEVVLFGVGKMGQAYTKVLQALKVKFQTVGRGINEVQKYNAEFGVEAIPGGHAAYLSSMKIKPTHYIVAVNVENLAEVAIDLMKKGAKRILLEKPAGTTIDEIKDVRELANKVGCKIYVAYNRRFYSSLIAAQKIIQDDGGVSSFSFDFTERTDLVHQYVKNDKVKKNWYFANSTHVVDMAYFLCGYPEKWATYVTGTGEWHPEGTIFSGAGITKQGALFSYTSNWNSAGRWALEVRTKNQRLLFCPLEKLQTCKKGQMENEYLEIDDKLDVQFKPGLYLQTFNFLEEIDHKNFVDINEHYNNMVNYYQLILRPDLQR